MIQSKVSHLGLLCVVRICCLKKGFNLPCHYSEQTGCYRRGGLCFLSDKKPAASTAKEYFSLGAWTVWIGASRFLLGRCSLSQCWRDLCPLARFALFPSLCNSPKYQHVLRKLTANKHHEAWPSLMFIIYLLRFTLNAGSECLLFGLVWIGACSLCSGHSPGLSPVVGVKIQ